MNSDLASGPNCHTRQEPLEAYLAETGHVSASRLRRALRGTPGERLDPAGIVRPYTPEMVMGEAAHAFLLDPPAFEQGFVAPGRGEPAAGMTDPRSLMNRVWLNDEQYAALQWAREAIERCAQAPAGEWLRAGLKELSIYWRDDAGRRWKARPDCFGEDFVLDLKTVQDARPRAFDAQRRRYGHDLQAAHYLDAVSQLGGSRGARLRFVWLALELKPPYALWVHELAPAQEARAMDELHRMREDYSRLFGARDADAAVVA